MGSRVTGRFFSYPDGFAWKAARLAGERLRRTRYDAMLKRVDPSESDTVLDVGATADTIGASNPLLSWYPWPGQVTACGLDDTPEICLEKGIRYVQSDGCDLPFSDGRFDIVHSNAVIEHVGNRDRQRQFVNELCRTGRCVVIATPDGDSPLEPHTLLPFVHWLPRRLSSVIYRIAGRGFFAVEKNLNPLGAGELKALFPEPLRRDVIILRQYFMGLPAVTLAMLIRPRD